MTYGGFFMKFTGKKVFAVSALFHALIRSGICRVTMRNRTYCEGCRLRHLPSESVQE